MRGKSYQDNHPKLHGGVPIIDEFNPADPDGAWTLYEGPKLCNCHENWVERIPEDVKFYQDTAEGGEGGEADQTKANTYALVLRKKRARDDGFIPKLHLQDIVVQSPQLVAVLRELFPADYPGISLSQPAPVLEAPFVPFFHYWSRWQGAIADQQDARTLLHMKLLDDVLREELAPAFAARAKSLEEGVVSFEFLWTLYDLGSLLFTSKNGPKRLYQLSYVQKTRDKLQLGCAYTDYDGKEFGRTTYQVVVSRFEGDKRVDTLFARPLSFIKDPDSIISELLRRGERVRQLAGIHCMEYNGEASSEHSNIMVKSKCANVEGRIVIDAEEMLRTKNEYWFSGNLQPWDLPQDAAAAAAAAAVPGPKWCGGVQATRDMQTYLMTPFVRGWSLRLNKWLTFNVDNVRPPRWDVDAFSHLILPADFRELIQATVETQLKRTSRFDDIISGKGRGFVLLFSGSQGVGKTATVETIAESLQAPLYVMTASQLGTKPSDMEKRLTDQLARAARWRAVLLLDEADIWVERRDGGNMHRNAIVTIFLRVLEYHQGVLCMTTNRSAAIDPAIHSRVHLSLRFPNLGPEAREEVWRHFARRAADALARNEDDGDQGSPPTTIAAAAGSAGTAAAAATLTDAQFRELAAVELDGRQIKNAFKTAMLLAEWKGRAVDFASLQQSVRIIEQQVRARQAELSEMSGLVRR